MLFATTGAEETRAQQATDRRRLVGRPALGAHDAGRATASWTRFWRWCARRGPDTEEAAPRATSMSPGDRARAPAKP